MTKDAINRVLDILEHNHGLTSTCGIGQCSCGEAQDWRDLKELLTVAHAPATPAWTCKARLSNMGANDPQECDWPFCGCDPYADKVLEAVQESRVAEAAPATPPADIMQLATRLAMMNGQVAGGKSNYFVTLEQLDEILRAGQGRKP